MENAGLPSLGGAALLQAQQILAVSVMLVDLAAGLIVGGQSRTPAHFLVVVPAAFVLPFFNAGAALSVVPALVIKVL